MRRLTSFRLNPEWFAVLLAAFATATSQTAATGFWPGLMVMVTALIAQLYLSSASHSVTAQPQTLCREPAAAIAFLFTTGVLMATSNRGLSLAGFVAMLFYFQTWRILNDPISDLSGAQAGDLQPVFLPEPHRIRQVMTRSVRTVFRRNHSWRLSLRGAELFRWSFQAILIVLLLVRKGVAT